MTKFYVIYDMEDNYIKECNDYIELCVFFDKNKNSMESSICRFRKGIRGSILSNRDGKHYKVYKYEDEENESKIHKDKNNNIR